MRANEYRRLFLRAGLMMALVAAFLAGCANIKPLPGDNGLGKRTVDIVHHVRCEARAAIAATTIEHLFHDRKMQSRPLTASERAQRNAISRFFSEHGAASLLDPSSSKSRFNWLIENHYDRTERRFTGNITKYPVVSEMIRIVQGFSTTVVGYTFTFTISEDNNAHAAINLKNPGFSPFSMTPAAKVERQRKNERVFHIVELIEDIVNDDSVVDDNGEYCSEKSKFHTNWAYPVSGKLNLAETFETFSFLILDHKLGRSKETVGEEKRVGEGTLSDELTFTTLVEGSVDPKVVLQPITSSLHVAGASGGYTGRRRDVHKLKLILRQPSDRSQIDAIIDRIQERQRDDQNRFVIVNQ